MDEVKTQPESRSDNSKPKLSDWPKRSFYYGLLAVGLLIVPGVLNTLMPRSIENNQIGFIFLIISCTVLFSPFVGLIAVVSGIWGLIKIRKKDFKAIIGIALGILTMLTIVGSDLLMRGNSHTYSHQKIQCNLNLRTLYEQIKDYSDTYGQYPSVDKWSDILDEHSTESDKSFFLCPAVKPTQPKRTSYAINPNVEPNSAPKVVLLFESKEGWNQFGGSELMTFENHKGKGCNVLFNDGHVEFIEPNRIGKLKWK